MVWRRGGGGTTQRTFNQPHISKRAISKQHAFSSSSSPGSAHHFAKVATAAEALGTGLQLTTSYDDDYYYYYDFSDEFLQYSMSGFVASESGTRMSPMSGTRTGFELDKNEENEPCVQDIGW